MDSPLLPLLAIIGVLAVILLMLAFTTVQQGTMAVVTMFGKYRRVLPPGLNVKIPLLEKIHQRVTIQNQSIELQFQAITQDQANVHFTAMMVYSVLDHNEETIKAVAFKFVNQANFMQALVRSIEGTIRSYVATKNQAQILGLRSEIISHVKEELDQQLEQWGYHLLDLQINDIAFDQAIMTSMAKVVASVNERTAAENDGAALLIRETKRAEAEGAAIKISAEAERQAAQLRGQGIALFRREVAMGMAAAVEEMDKAHLNSSLIAYSMWTETMRHVASEGNGNVIMFDGSLPGMERTLQQLNGMNLVEYFEAGSAPGDQAKSTATSRATLPPPPH